MKYRFLAAAIAVALSLSSSTRAADVQTAAGGLISACQTAPAVTAANGGTGVTNSNEQCYDNQPIPQPVLGAGAIQIGDGAGAMNAGDIAMGVGANTTRALIPAGTPSGDYTAVENAIAIGTQAYAGWDNSIAFGPASQAWAAGGVAIGSNAQVGAMGIGSVAIGQGSIAGGPMEVSVGDIGKERRITNVAAGFLGTDALNVGQFDGGAVAIAGWIGGGAYFGLETQGGIAGSSQPTFTIQGIGYNDVASAFSAVDFRISDLYNRISNLSAGPQGPDGGGGTDGLVVRYDGADAQTATLSGKDGTRLRNLAAGIDATDASTLGQVRAGDAATLATANRYTDEQTMQALASAKAYTDLRSHETLQQANAYTDMRLGRVNQRIDYALAAGMAGSQAAAALAGSNPANRNRVAMGFGHAGGVQAWNVTYQHVNEGGNVSWNVGGGGGSGMSGSDAKQIGVGVAFGW